jgi:hypothetical protein
MSTSDGDAQRELEQRALRNVRGLVDRIEQDDTADRRTQKRILWGILVFALVLALGVGAISWRASQQQKPVVIDPAKLPPIQPGPNRK